MAASISSSANTSSNLPLEVRKQLCFQNLEKLRKFHEKIVDSVNGFNTKLKKAQKELHTFQAVYRKETPGFLSNLLNLKTDLVLNFEIDKISNELKVTCDNLEQNLTKAKLREQKVEQALRAAERQSYLPTYVSEQLLKQALNEAVTVCPELSYTGYTETT